jgi:hypothetical protein
MQIILVFQNSVDTFGNGILIRVAVFGHRIAPFAEAVAELETLIAGIDAIWQSTDEDQSGLVIEKNSIKVEVIDDDFEIASQLFAMASKTGDNTLKSKVNYQKSEFVGMRDAELTVNSKSILGFARAYITALSPYNITENRLAQFEALIARYENSLPVARVSVSERKADNAKLKELLAHSKVLLKDQVKRMMSSFVKTNPDFYAGYVNASKVVDYGTRYEKEVVPETVQ